MLSILKDIRSGALSFEEIPGFIFWLVCTYMDPFWFHNPWDLPPRFHDEVWNSKGEVHATVIRKD